MARPIAFFVAVLLPILSLAQSPPPLDLSALRAKAQLEGSVEVKVVTRAVAGLSAARKPTLTAEQRREVQRAQDKILIPLIARGLVVGNEIFVQPDGSFTMRVLPDGLEQLARGAEVQELRASDHRQTRGIAQ